MALPVDVRIGSPLENQWDRYRPQVVRSFFYNLWAYQLLMGRFRKATFDAVDSNKLVIATELAPPLNAASRVEGDDMPQADRPDLLQFRVPIADEFGTLRFTDRQKRRIRENKNAFIDLPGKQFEYAKNAMFQDINRQIMGFGDGALATVSAGATTSSGVGIPIQGLPGVRPPHLKRRQRVTIYRGSSAVTNAADADQRLVQNVRYNRANQQWYVDLAHESGVTSDVTVAAGDKIYINGARGKEGQGVLMFLHQDTPASGALDPFRDASNNPRNRETYPELQALHWGPTADDNLYPDLAHGGKFTVRQFRLLMEYLRSQAPDGMGGRLVGEGEFVLWGHPAFTRFVMNAFDGLRQFRPGEPLHTAWPGAVNIEGVDILPDYDWPYGTGVVLFLPCWDWYQEAELEFVDGGGESARWQRVGRKAEHEAYLWYAWQLWCNIPTANAYCYGFVSEGERFGQIAAA